MQSQQSYISHNIICSDKHISTTSTAMMINLALARSNLPHPKLLKLLQHKMYHHPIIAKLGRVSQISVDHCLNINKSVAIFHNQGTVLPNLPYSQLPTPDYSDLVVSHDHACLRSLSKSHNQIMEWGLNSILRCWQRHCKRERSHLNCFKGTLFM